MTKRGVPELYIAIGTVPSMPTNESYTKSPLPSRYRSDLCRCQLPSLAGDCLWHLAGRRAALQNAHVICRVVVRGLAARFSQNGKKTNVCRVSSSCLTSTHNSQRPFRPRISPRFIIFVFDSLLHIARSPPIRYQKLRFFSRSRTLRRPLFRSDPGSFDPNENFAFQTARSSSPL